MLLLRVLSRIRFPDIYADLLFGYWHAYPWLRYFDPHKDLVTKAVSLPAPHVALFASLCWCAVPRLLYVPLKEQWNRGSYQLRLPQAPTPVRKTTPLSLIPAGLQWLRCPACTRHKCCTHCSTARSLSYCPMLLPLADAVPAAAAPACFLGRA